MSPALTPELLSALKRLDTCTLSNAIEVFNLRLRNEGFCDSSIRCLFPSLAPMTGHAVTIRVRGRRPALDGHTYYQDSGWWDHILSQPAPRVVVIQDMDRVPGLGAFVGEVHAAILGALGCVGAVTNGAVRDLPAVEAAKFPLFAHHVAVAHSYAHVVEIGTEVEIGGLKIRPGDWLHGDVHGVLSIPPDSAPNLIAEADRILAREKQILAICKANDFTPQKLRQFLQDTALHSQP